MKLARRESMTVIAAVHQPSGDVFELFNGLCLLAYGKTIYFGPPSAANEFFALNGVPCPSLTNPSDHYLKSINKDFDKEGEGFHHTRWESYGPLLYHRYKMMAKLTMDANPVLETSRESCESDFTPVVYSRGWADIRFCQSMEDAYVCCDNLKHEHGLHFEFCYGITALVALVV